MENNTMAKILIAAAVIIMAAACFMISENSEDSDAASYSAKTLYDMGNGATVSTSDSSVTILEYTYEEHVGEVTYIASPSSFTLSAGGTKSVVIREALADDGSLIGSHTVTFTRPAATTYTVYFAAGSGGSVSRTSQSTTSTTGTFSCTATPNTNYVFDGWYDNNGDRYSTNTTLTGTIKNHNGLTYTAEFTYSPSYTCYLYYNANGGSGAPSTQSYTGTSTSSHSFTVASGTPTRSGYDFLGWSTSSSASSASYSAGSSISVSYNGSKTLYAVWKEQVSTYQVTVYKGNWQSFKLLSDGTTYTSSSHTYVINAGQTIDVDWYGKDSESGSGTNYTYTTTYTAHEYQMASSLYGTALGDSVTVNGNASYYPASQMQSTTAYTYSYTISYNANGGSGAPGSTTDTGSSTSKSITLSSSVPTWSGHQFLGWSTSSSATTATYSAGGSYTFNYGTTALYAVWKEASLSIGSVSKQYAVVGQGVSFGATCTPSNVSVTYASSNASSGLAVSVSGSNITCNANTAGTYTFTLTASASGYTSSSTTVTVQFVPVLAFTNAPSIGVIGS